MMLHNDISAMLKVLPYLKLNSPKRMSKKKKRKKKNATGTMVKARQTDVINSMSIRDTCGTLRCAKHKVQPVGVV